MPSTVFEFDWTTPKINLRWWMDSKNELTDIVEEYNKRMWPQERSPVNQQKWKPRKKPTGNWPILKKTGLMQDSAKFRAGAQPFDFIAETVYYGPFMQYGTSTVPARTWLGVGRPIYNDMARVIGKNIFKGKTTLTLRQF